MAIRDFAQAVEDLGFNHYGFAERVVQNDASKLPELGGRGGNHRAPFNEVFTLMSFLAGVTKRIELCSCILILPIRPTALVAKQAAHADMLSGGRVRLGVAVGGSAMEYEAMGVDFHTRGARMDEQIEVLRRLWTEDSVFVQSRFHNLRHATLNPRPSRPIPIWIGSGNTRQPVPAERLLRRAARLADGFIAMSLVPPEEAGDVVARLRQYAGEYGRAPETFGIEGDITLTGKTPDRWREETQCWRAAGADRLMLRMRDLTTREQLENLRVYKRDILGQP
ncbi:MAG: TIGR03619 family F420-dependent LLM class oxidoreductase [Chloroflexota bacterium]